MHFFCHLETNSVFKGPPPPNPMPKMQSIQISMEPAKHGTSKRSKPQLAALPGGAGLVRARDRWGPEFRFGWVGSSKPICPQKARGLTQVSHKKQKLAQLSRTNNGTHWFPHKNRGLINFSVKTTPCPLGEAFNMFTMAYVNSEWSPGCVALPG